MKTAVETFNCVKPLNEKQQDKTKALLADHTFSIKSVSANVFF